MHSLNEPSFFLTNSIEEAAREDKGGINSFSKL
jgi:hypothetical protein